MKFRSINLVPSGTAEALGCGVAGMVMGALSWALCPLIGGRIEPFDNGAAFLAGQVLMTLGTFWIGWATGSWGKVALTVLGLYIGQVLYSAVAVGTEWILLGMVTILALCVFPAVGGLLSLAIGKAARKRIGRNL